MDTGRSTPTLGFVLFPLVTATMAAAVGVIVGAAVMAIVQHPEPPVPPTPSERVTLCALEIASKQAEVDEATNQVDRLSLRIEEREARVAALEADMAQRAERGRALSRELNQAKAELAALREELSVAVAEKTRLQTELTAVVAKLETTEVALGDMTRRADRAEDDALDNRWHRFVANAQLDICEKGGRKKLDRCRETVEAKVGATQHRTTFEHCVRAGASTPSVLEPERGAALPRYAVRIDEADHVTEGWVIQFCDPTLPEAEFFAASPRPAPAMAAPPRAVAPEAAEPEVPARPTAAAARPTAPAARPTAPASRSTVTATPARAALVDLDAERAPKARPEASRKGRDEPAPVRPVLADDLLSDLPEAPDEAPHAVPPAGSIAESVLALGLDD